jgi:hypothetical protein
MIDLEKLKRDLAATALECTQLKRGLRRRWTAPMGDVQRALLRSRRRATELCVLRAHLRGRYHLTKSPRDGSSPAAVWNVAVHHAEIAARVAADYVLQVPPVTLEVG